MEKTRTERIRDIRARLPYMSEKNLEILDGFAFALVRREGYCYSVAEHDRPVLEPEQQEGADRAALCMRTIADALTQTRGVMPAYIEDGDADPATDARCIGWAQGDLVALDVRRMMELWNDAGWKRTARASLIEWMERSGFILPRHHKPKTIMVDGERREVVYLFKNKLQPFIDEAARL